MSIDLAKAGPSGCRGDDLGDPAAGEGAMRSLDPHEYRPARRACGPAVAQIRSHRFTDVRRQRETLGTVCFAADDDLAGPPPAKDTGSRAVYFASPGPTTSAPRHSISSSRSLATSPDRMPRRTSMVRT